MFPLHAGSVIALPAPVRLDWDHPCLSGHFSSCGSHYPVTSWNVLERVGRVELRIIGLEGRWTPLVLSTRLLVAEEGIEPPTPAYETGKIPFLYSAIVGSAYDYAESVLMLVFVSAL